MKHSHIIAVQQSLSFETSPCHQLAPKICYKNRRKQHSGFEETHVCCAQLNKCHNKANFGKAGILKAAVSPIRSLLRRSSLIKNRLRKVQLTLVISNTWLILELTPVKY